MMHYPLSTLMLAEMSEVLVITTTRNRVAFHRHHQSLADAPALLVLGVTLFNGHELIPQFRVLPKALRGSVFTYPVRDLDR